MRNSAYAIPFFCLTINKKYDIIKGDIYYIYECHQFYNLYIIYNYINSGIYIIL